MSLPNQYQAVFDLIFDDEFRQRYLNDPASALSERELGEDEIEALTTGQLSRLEGESLANKAVHLSRFFGLFPKTMYLLVSLDRSLEPLYSFFRSRQFRACFQSQESFTNGFSLFLAEQTRLYADRAPYLVDLYIYEESLRSLKRLKDVTFASEPFDRKRPLARGRYGILQLFNYPIMEIVEYINYFTTSPIYRLAPLWAAGRATMPSLLMPHHPLPEPMSLLFLLRKEEPSMIKIKPYQYQAVIACDGSRGLDELIEDADPAYRSKLENWLLYCWSNGVIGYLQ